MRTPFLGGKILNQIAISPNHMLFALRRSWCGGLIAWTTGSRDDVASCTLSEKANPACWRSCSSRSWLGVRLRLRGGSLGPGALVPCLSAVLKWKANDSRLRSRRLYLDLEDTGVWKSPGAVIVIGKPNRRPQSLYSTLAHTLALSHLVSDHLALKLRNYEILKERRNVWNLLLWARMSCSAKNSKIPVPQPTR